MTDNPSTTDITGLNAREAADYLFEGGWRASDYDELREEYGISHEDAERICDSLDRILDRILEPVTIALADLELAYEKYTDAPDDAEAQAIMREIDGYAHGFLRFQGSGWRALACASVSDCVAEGIGAVDLRFVVRHVRACLEQAIELLSQNPEEE